MPLTRRCCLPPQNNIPKRRKRPTYRPLIAAALTVTTLAAPALATTSTFRMEVAYTKANLATPTGAAVEHANIREQVAERCETEHGPRGRMEFGRAIQVQACTGRTLTTALNRIDHPNLTAAHIQAKG